MPSVQAQWPQLYFPLFPPAAEGKQSMGDCLLVKKNNSSLKVCSSAVAGRIQGWGELRAWQPSPGCTHPRMTASLSASGSQLQWRKSATRRHCSGPEQRHPVWKETGSVMQEDRLGFQRKTISKFGTPDLFQPTFLVQCCDIMEASPVSDAGWSKKRGKGLLQTNRSLVMFIQSTIHWKTVLFCFSCIPRLTPPRHVLVPTSEATLFVSPSVASEGKTVCFLEIYKGFVIINRVSLHWSRGWKISRMKKICKWVIRL